MERPTWANELAKKYLSSSVCQFILYGAVTDLVATPIKGGKVEFRSLRHYLTKSLFKDRSSVICYDPSSGISFSDQRTVTDFNSVAGAVDSIAGTKYNGVLPKEASKALFLIERYIRARCFGATKDQSPKSVAVIIDFAQMVVPAGELNHLSAEETSTLVTLLKWANDPEFLNGNITICLLAENLADINTTLVKNPHIAKVEVGLPNAAERQEFLQFLYEKNNIKGELVTTTNEYGASYEVYAEGQHIPVDVLTKLTAGLSRVSLIQIVNQAISEKQPISSSYVQSMKKELIEKECYGLLEFLEPTYTLDMVSGCKAAKDWLKADAGLVKAGRTDVLPMGYLICGPVGTGKTFMAQCYTGTIGIPCVKLLNFRSQWQGVTEGNWEKILNVLKATGPVGVIIDEADAAVGNRGASGDSGTSARVFSQLAATMGDTRYRGKIIWFLLTCRPDLLPVDLKRQGRCEVHIPLFYPETHEERLDIFKLLAKKTGIGKDISEDDLTRLLADAPDLVLNGAEVESAFIRAKRTAIINNRDKVSVEDIQHEMETYLQPQYGEELEIQKLAAIVDCSNSLFLPNDLRKMNRREAMDKLHRLKSRWDR